MDFRYFKSNTNQTLIHLKTGLPPLWAVRQHYKRLQLLPLKEFGDAIKIYCVPKLFVLSLYTRVKLPNSAYIYLRGNPLRKSIFLEKLDF